QPNCRQSYSHRESHQRHSPHLLGHCTCGRLLHTGYLQNDQEAFHRFLYLAPLLQFCPTRPHRKNQIICASARLPKNKVLVQEEMSRSWTLCEPRRHPLPSDR
ncbi:unnamed protein product, partial [Ixodes persulcatus]